MAWAATRRTTIVTARIEDASQTGLTTGPRLATAAKERVTALV